MFVLDDESLSLCSDNCYSVVAVTVFLFVAVLICISLRCHFSQQYLTCMCTCIGSVHAL